MNDMTPFPKKRELSLLERAAAMGAGSRPKPRLLVPASAPFVPSEVDAQIAPGQQGRSTWFGPNGGGSRGTSGTGVVDLGGTLAAIPPEFLANADAGEDDFTPPPVTPGEALIDRGRLAENGMIVPGAPVGPLAEEFRLVKRQLSVTRQRLASAGEVDKSRTLLVCSARPGDGKTFCAINLALSMAAERDTQVLLVDADVAKPDVCRRLGLEPGPGLLDALYDGTVDPEALVVRTDVPNLSVLSSGAMTAMDTELLASARTRAVIARLLAAQHDRIIIFDSPPALAASPAAVLAGLVGQVMLVVRADRTPESEVAAAVALLDGCEHIGLVLNAVSFVPDRHRFGSYYGQELTP
ncbi:MAG: chromosome partitioning protein [Sphingomonas bacterium]|uniref:AAA family ATPase n=1 Tax=Sphingomonas bacterium TaxID=1895847 RepID=UPI002629A3B4|nr:AAA family ATPase [Sphingomonas bacterium]MDB5695433.1 chromosome partitioning protein [Sphingomonas bacterium]